MSDYQHGSMDITEQKKTWKGFMSLVIWSSAGLLAILVLMGLFLL